jgi:Alanine racemase, N-terminal domain.
LDRIRLAQEIEKEAAQIEREISVLVQVNISGESTKSGIRPEDTLDFINSIKQYSHIRVKGLMTIGPLKGDADVIRACFRHMKKLFDQAKQENMPRVEMQYLSMGMTNDFDIAIEEGANMVRIGRAIFGERKK